MSNNITDFISLDILCYNINSSHILVPKLQPRPSKIQREPHMHIIYLGINDIFAD